jgi:hypothetical protein
MPLARGIESPIDEEEEKRTGVRRGKSSAVVFGDLILFRWKYSEKVSNCSGVMFRFSVKS